MNHAVAIGAQHRKVGGNVIGDRHPLLQRRDRLEMVGFNKAFANRAIALFKIEITGLANRAVEFFGLLGGGAVAFNLAVKSVFIALESILSMMTLATS